MDTFIQLSDTLLAQLNTFPMPWSNRRGPWVTPAVSVSLISRKSGSVSAKHLPVPSSPLFIISLPLSLSKVSAMNQRLAVIQKKLVPKIWNDVISAWVPDGCLLLGVEESHCNITCDRLGLVAVEYDTSLFACGDGVRDPDEQCDDWNDRNGDGCDSQCRIEAGWQCQKGSYPATKFGFDSCSRLPCYAPYNCAGVGICTPLNTCACETGFIGTNCNISLLVISQTRLNFTADQLPKQLRLSTQDAVAFTLTIHKVANASNQTVVVTLANYESNSFPYRPSVADVPPPNKTISAPSEFFLLSNIVDIRIYSSLTLTASAVVEVPNRWIIIRRSNGASVNFTLDNPHSNVTWRVLMLDAGGSDWKQVDALNASLSSVSRVSIGFPVTENGYYAVFALLPPIYGQIPKNNPPPSPPVTSEIPEPPPNYTAVILGGTLAAVSLIGFIAYGIWRWRRNRRQAILSMYYSAVSKTKGKRPMAPQQQASGQHLERPETTETQNQHLERPPLPDAASSPSKSRLRIWNAVNRYKSSPSNQLPKSPIRLPEEEQPPPAAGGDRMPDEIGSESLNHEKSLLAAAIRSKMLRKRASIYKAEKDKSDDRITSTSMSATVDSINSENDVQASDLRSVSLQSIVLDEIQLQLPAQNVDTGNKPSREAREAFSADSWGNFDTSLIRDAEVESVSEDPTIWRAHEHCDESNVDVHSAASADSGALSVFSALTESHATAVYSDAIDAEHEQMSVASRESVEDES
jgi:cysteine-rich repeat protein